MQINITVVLHCNATSLSISLKKKKFSCLKLIKITNNNNFSKYVIFRITEIL